MMVESYIAMSFIVVLLIVLLCMLRQAAINEIDRRRTIVRRINRYCVDGDGSNYDEAFDR